MTTIQNAHHIYLLDNGSVIEQGTHDTLMAKENGIYQQMVNIQQMEAIDDNQIMTQSELQADDENIMCM